MRFQFRQALLALAFAGMAMAPAASFAQADNAAQKPGSAPGDTQPAGSEPPHAGGGPTGGSAGNGPIGAGPQTMPAKFDANVAERDQIPIMARPLPLTDEQRRQIFDTVMNDAHAPANVTGAAPATILPGSVELGELPSAMQEQIPAVRGYKYVKLPDKVLLVAPANRVVVGEIGR